MEESPKGWKDKAMRPAKYAGGATLAGALMFAATELRALTIDYVSSVRLQAVAVDKASKKFDLGLKTLERKTHRDIQRLEDREDKKDDLLRSELQGLRADNRLILSLLNTMKADRAPAIEPESTFGRTDEASTSRKRKQRDG